MRCYEKSGQAKLQSLAGLQNICSRSVRLAQRIPAREPHVGRHRDIPLFGGPGREAHSGAIRRKDSKGPSQQVFITGMFNIQWRVSSVSDIGN